WPSLGCACRAGAARVGGAPDGTALATMLPAGARRVKGPLVPMSREGRPWRRAGRPRAGRRGGGTPSAADQTRRQNLGPRVADPAGAVVDWREDALVGQGVELLRRHLQQLPGLVGVHGLLTGHLRSSVCPPARPAVTAPVPARGARR